MNILLILKRLLKSIDDKDLEEMNLWVDNSDNIELVAVDDNSITLVTKKEKLSIDGLEW
jgi:hypothetical protein